MGLYDGPSTVKPLRTTLELFRDTFERREDAELCVPCAEAVLDVAGR